MRLASSTLVLALLCVAGPAHAAPVRADSAFVRLSRLLVPTRVSRTRDRSALVIRDWTARGREVTETVIPYSRAAYRRALLRVAWNTPIGLPLAFAAPLAPIGYGFGHLIDLHDPGSQASLIVPVLFGAIGAANGVLAKLQHPRLGE